jgi:glycosyltransferase involved in cell wall biosynthesis
VEVTAIDQLEPQLATLQQRGFDVRLSCQPGLNGFDPSLLPFSPVEVRYPRRLDPIAMAKASKRMVAILNELRPAAVHLHTPATALPFRLIPRRFLPKGLKVFYTVHGFAHHWGTGKSKDFVLERAERMLARRTDVMLFQSGEDLENAQLHHYRSKLVLLGNGVGDEWFALPPLRRRQGPLRAMFVGRLVREKGILDLLEAMSHVPEAELVVVGEQLPSDRGGVGEEVARLVGSVELAGRVLCIGRLSQVELREQMLSTDVVVLPSYREGLSRSLIEGLAAGRPLLATETRGCRELITEGINGFLVPVGRPDRLERALKTLAKLTPGELAAMGGASKNRALASHREQVIFDCLEASYKAEGLHPAST